MLESLVEDNDCPSLHCTFIHTHTTHQQFPLHQHDIGVGVGNQKPYEDICIQRVASFRVIHGFNVLAFVKAWHFCEACCVSVDERESHKDSLTICSIGGVMLQCCCTTNENLVPKTVSHVPNPEVMHCDILNLFNDNR